MAGGRINTDAIDNSAGVDCSDHEVNIKILLDAVVADGDLTVKQRNALLAEMTDDVARLVLRDNYRQTQALSNAVEQAPSMVDVHARSCSTSSRPAGSAASSSPCRARRRSPSAAPPGAGLVAPELAVLLAYAKIELYDALLASDLPEDDFTAAGARRATSHASSPSASATRWTATACAGRSSPPP